MATAVARTYTNFAGVDFSTDSSLIEINRSPDALNVWKDYKDRQGTCICTRPGYSYISQIGTNILGMYIVTDSKVIVHSGNKLYEWSNLW